jgi:nicotinamidase-related amidase
MTDEPFVATPENTAVLLIDVQPYFLEGWMAGDAEALLMRLEFLLAAAERHALPVLATFEEPVMVKGWLPERLERRFPAAGQRLTKDAFNCCGEATIREAIAALDRECIAVAGAETDVCVLQSVLGIMGLGKRVMLLEDALFSSEPHTGPAIRRMEAAGAIPATVKSFEYELRRTVSAGGTHRLACGAGLPEPERLPPWSPSGPV